MLAISKSLRLFLAAFVLGSANFGTTLSQDIPAGVDMFETPGGGTTYVTIPPEMPIPPDFFGPGSLPFDGTIVLVGVPLQTSPPDALRPVDTIVKRLADASFSPTCLGSSQTIPIEIVALSLRSSAPITVFYSNMSTELWDLDIYLSSINPQGQGTMTIKRVCPSGGTFDATLPVTTRLVFTKVGTSETRVIDGARSDTFKTVGGTWVYDDGSIPDLVTSHGGITVDHDGNPSTPGVPVAPSTNFLPSVAQDPCVDCNSSGGGKVKKLTTEQARWAAHGIKVPKRKPFPPGFPCAGTDEMNSVLRADSVVIDGHNLGPVFFSGSTNVSRGEIHFDQAGVSFIPTEIVQMQLSGPMGFIQLSGPRSTGEVRGGAVGQDFPASSFFDVFAAITGPFGQLFTYNPAAPTAPDPAHMVAEHIRQLPPCNDGDGCFDGVDEYSQRVKRLYDASGVERGMMHGIIHCPSPSDCPPPLPPCKQPPPPPPPDTIPPVIDPWILDKIVLGSEGTRIMATITDNAKVQSATLYVSYDGGPTTAIPMKTDGNSFGSVDNELNPGWGDNQYWAVTENPNSLTTSSTLSYFIEATDPSGNVRTTPPFMTVFNRKAPVKIDREVPPLSQYWYEQNWYGYQTNSWCVPTATAMSLWWLGFNDTTKKGLVSQLADLMQTDGKITNVDGQSIPMYRGTFWRDWAWGIHRFLKKHAAKEQYDIKVYTNDKVGPYPDNVILFDRQPTFEDYVEEIKKGEDVMLGLKWLKGGGHAVTGIGQDVATRAVRVMDPAGRKDPWGAVQVNFHWDGKIVNYNGMPARINFMIVVSRRENGAIYGRKFDDVNGNCLQDAGEVGLKRWLIKLSPLGHYAVTDTNGDYCFMDVPPGTYTVSEVLQPGWQQTCPPGGSYAVTVGPGGQVTNVDFGNRRPGTVQDLCVYLAAGRARPGFQKVYDIRYCNKGTTKKAATVTLQLDSNVVWKSSSIGGVYNATTHTVTWTVGPLQPGAVGGLSTTVTVKVVPIGTSLTACAKIEPDATDVTPADNVRCETQIVRGSYDPNEKLVVPVGFGPDALISVSDVLTYQINFQNVGNDTAFTVVVRDTVDPNLDLSTIVFGSSSHSYDVEIFGRTLVFTFTDINLPDSTTDEPGSNGFVWYDIRPNEGTQLGTDVRNRAAIYFDFNPPIITNTVTNRIGACTGVLVTERWNMLSNPASTGTDEIALIYPGGASAAFKYDPTTGYEPTSTLPGGVGVWLRFAAAESFCIFGVPHESLTVPVAAAWNMIGSVGSPIPVNTITSNPAEIVRSRYFGYASGVGYFPADSIMPGRSYWVKSGEVGQLRLNTEQTASTSSVSRRGVEGMSSLKIKAGNGMGQTLYFGKRALVHPGLDPEEFSLPPKPPDGVFDARFASNRMVELFGESGRFEFPIHVSSSMTPLVVEWSVKGLDGWRATVLGADRDVRLIGDGSATIGEIGSEMILRIESASSVGIPERYALHQNYPNPFNPTTTIRFDLPDPAGVTLTVFNVVGQAVATVLNGKHFESGQHEVVFDAAGLVSGAYLYRIQANSFRDERVMMILK